MYTLHVHVHCTIQCDVLLFVFVVQGFDPGQDTYQAPPVDGSQRTVDVDPNRLIITILAFQQLAARDCDYVKHFSITMHEAALYLASYSINMLLYSLIIKITCINCNG